MVRVGLARTLLVIGAGPIGLVAAIRAQELGLDVEIWTDRLPDATDPPWLELVPAQLIALLVEMGVHPYKFGVEQLSVKRFTQWRSPKIERTEGPLSAHITRPALELALLEVVGRARIPIRVVSRSTVKSLHCEKVDNFYVIDATGRAAATAAKVVRPSLPIVCCTFSQHLTATDEIDGFALAAGPNGYVYRLSNSRHLVLGIVGHRSHIAQSGSKALALIREFAPWIVAGITEEGLAISRAGPASLQWTETKSSVACLVGDARISRDALASQGLAIGVSDALKAVDDIAKSQPVFAQRAGESVSLHASLISTIIKESPFSRAQAWSNYLEFLEQQLHFKSTAAEFENSR
jgi:2-polyprenyl-6-methoxyphenol hydroxylase-like FAD-dependent oxidoreductase